MADEIKLYEITNRETGVKSFQVATTADDACKQAGWQIGNCFVNEEQPRRRPVPNQETALLFKIPCATCTFQWAECKKPAGEDCITRPQSPELQDWLRQAAESHLCPYVGVELNKKDYHLGQKWVIMEEAIKELAPKSLRHPPNG